MSPTTTLQQLKAGNIAVVDVNTNDKLCDAYKTFFFRTYFTELNIIDIDITAQMLIYVFVCITLWAISS